MENVGDDEGASSQLAPSADPTPSASAAQEPESVAKTPGEVRSAELLPNGPKSPLQQWQTDLQYRGFLWLFAIGGVWLVRMLIDPALKRKPFLESNLSSGGLTFLVCSLMFFLFANVLISRPQVEDISGARGAVEIVHGTQQDLRRFGPGYALFHLFPTIPTIVNETQLKSREPIDHETTLHKYEAAAKTMAIISQIAIVLALIYFGRNHFGDTTIGVGMAAIYLLLPYTAQMTGRVMHLLPAALLVWSITLYRIPAASGVLLGLAASVAYYPLFLIPLFISFYWLEGRKRFVLGLTAAIVLAVASLLLTSSDWTSFRDQLRAMFGFWLPISENLEGIWSLGWASAYRIPFLVGFVALCITFAFWPATKNLGSLISCSCAAMIAVQFWHGFGGGLYMAWYLPLALLIVFRPNLDDRTAEQYAQRRKRHQKSVLNPTTELTAA
ncbi:MAG TPA: hypothetical protein PKA83_16455 [Pirellulaceae bacterium]|nr:hypothetical protein [Pirellulaceae bacterium]